MSRENSEAGIGRRPEVAAPTTGVLDGKATPTVIVHNNRASSGFQPAPLPEEENFIITMPLVKEFTPSNRYELNLPRGSFLNPEYSRRAVPEDVKFGQC